MGRCASWRAGSDLPVSLSGEVAEARRSRVARSAIARDAVGVLDVGGAASDTAQRPLDQCDCFDRLRPPLAVAAGSDVPGVGQLLTRLSTESDATEEKEIQVWFDSDQVQVFDPSDGRNLTLLPGMTG